MSQIRKVTLEKLKTSVAESARKVCGVTRGQKRKERETWRWAEEVQLAVKNKKIAFREWHGNREDAALRSTYTTRCRQEKKAVAKAKSDSMKHIYEELNAKEGEAKIYKIAKARQKSTQDKQSVKID